MSCAVEILNVLLPLLSRCAVEHNKDPMKKNCACSGKVIYGNWNGWTDPKEIEGCIECNNGECLAQ